MKYINLSKNFIICHEQYYQWNRQAEVDFLYLAHQYSNLVAGFYTDYLDVDGIKRVQPIYNRKRIAEGYAPLGFWIVRTPLARHVAEDMTCGDWSCLDLWLTLTDVGPFVHLPIIGFSEIERKIYNTDKQVVFNKHLKGR